MKHVTLLTVSSLALAGFVMVAAHAEEGLLWKVKSPYQASVVPPFTNQDPPFPIKKVEVEKTEEEERLEMEMLEVERDQQEKIAEARKFLTSPQAMVPFLDGMAVGGMVDGGQGRKVLLGNNWVGKGAEVTVRLMITADAKRAVADVAAFDEPLALQLKSDLMARLNSTPVTKLKVKDIKSNALVLDGPYGEKVLNFTIE